MKSANKRQRNACSNYVPSNEQLSGLRALKRKKKHHIFAPTAVARCTILPKLCMVVELVVPIITRSSADADNRLDAFSGQSRSTNMVPFHMLHIVSYCAIVTLSLRKDSCDRVHLRYSSKNFMTLKWGSKVTQGHWEWYHSIDCVWFPIRSPSSISVPNLKQISTFVQKL